MNRACSSLADFIARGAPPRAGRLGRERRGQCHRPPEPGLEPAARPRGCRRAPRAKGLRPGSTASRRSASPASTEAISGSRKVVSNWWRAIHRQVPGSRGTIDGRSTNTGSALRNRTFAGVASLSCQPRGSSARASSSVRVPAAASISGRPLGGLADEGNALVLEALAVEVGELRRRLDARQRPRADDRPWSIQWRTTGSSSIRRNASSACPRTARTSRPS